MCIRDRETTVHEIVPTFTHNSYSLCKYRCLKSSQLDTSGNTDPTGKSGNRQKFLFQEKVIPGLQQKFLKME